MPPSKSNKPKNMSTHNSQPSPAAPIPLEASHGVHVFEVTNYSRYRDLGVSSFRSSAAFHVGGCAWSVRFYPCGHDKRSPEGYVSVGLELMTQHAVATVLFGMRLIDHETGTRYAGVEGVIVDFDTRCVKSFVHLCNLSRFMRKTELEASTYLRDDCIAIECTVRVIKGTRDRASPPEINHVPPSDLPDHLGRLLEEGMGTDVTFEVKDKAFPAHRILLAARSPVFMAELLGPMKEGRVHRIPIHEIEPEVFEAFLYFIYTDSLPAAMDHIKKEEQTRMIGGLLIAADRYAMDRLKLVCEDTLSRSLTVEKASDMLTIADTYNCRALKDACIQFLMTSNRTDDVTRSEEGYMTRMYYALKDVLAKLLEKAVKS